MARSRNIKPGFFQNEYLAELEPLARILFQGLWCLADREGRLEDRPKKIKAEILPYDNCDIDKLLNALVSAGEQFIVRYQVDGKRYIQITNFLKHQNPHLKESKSTIPAPNEHHTSTMQEQYQHQTSPADSLNLIPDSLNPHTDSIIEEDEERVRAGKVYQFYQSNIGLITEFQAEIISQHLDDGMDPDMIIEVMKDSLGKSDKWSWIKKVLSNLMEQNIKTLEQYKAKKAERENIRNKGKPQKSSNPFFDMLEGNGEL